MTLLVCCNGNVPDVLNTVTSNHLSALPVSRPGFFISVIHLDGNSQIPQAVEQDLKTGGPILLAEYYPCLNLLQAHCLSWCDATIPQGCKEKIRSCAFACEISEDKVQHGKGLCIYLSSGAISRMLAPLVVSGQLLRYENGLSESQNQ